MTTGRRPIPTDLKKLKGNPGRRPLNPNEPQPKAGSAAQPSALSQAAREYWPELHEIVSSNGVYTEMDTVALVLLCDTFAEYRKLRDQVEREGATYTLPNGMAKANPAMAMLSDSQKRLKSLLVEFGMTPSARSRVTVAGEIPPDPIEEFFKKRGR